MNQICGACFRRQSTMTKGVALSESRRKGLLALPDANKGDLKFVYADAQIRPGTQDPYCLRRKNNRKEHEFAKEMVAIDIAGTSGSLAIAPLPADVASNLMTFPWAAGGNRLAFSTAPPRLRKSQSMTANCNSCEGFPIFMLRRLIASRTTGWCFRPLRQAWAGFLFGLFSIARPR